jgi:hypothetical protein
VARSFHDHENVIARRGDIRAFTANSVIAPGNGTPNAGLPHAVILSELVPGIAGPRSFIDDLHVAQILRASASSRRG